MPKIFSAMSPPTVPQICLRPLTVAAAPAMLQWMRDPDVADNVGLRSEPSLEKTVAWIERTTADPDMAVWAITAAGAHVGNVILDRIDRHLGTARLSIYIGEPEARGKGIGQQAVRLAADQAFTVLNLNKVWLTVHQHNARAIAAYRRAGFLAEGLLREEFVLRGEKCHAVVMGLLRREFNRKAA
ncbi:MAG: GNAT family protein [Pirellulales bacterium]|nr:GNAT family protein [Pirellulales bacterium]